MTPCSGSAKAGLGNTPGKPGCLSGLRGSRTLPRPRATPRPKTSRRTWVSPLEVETEFGAGITMRHAAGNYNRDPRQRELEVLLKEDPVRLPRSPGSASPRFDCLHAAPRFEKARVAETALSARRTRTLSRCERWSSLANPRRVTRGKQTLTDQHALRRRAGTLVWDRGRETATSCMAT